MNRLLIIMIALMAASSFAWHIFHKSTISKAATQPPAIKKKNDARAAELTRLRINAGRIKQFAKENNYNTRYCFLVDMKIASGSNRFFVYDLQNDSVLSAGLVAHGYGNSSAGTVSFSNIPGSNSSSQGRYKIGNAYHGRFGLAYKLYGLDKTNSNAFNRFVVLHAHECVPAREVSPGYICMSQGCPTVAPAFLKTLSAFTEKAERPLLLWIFN